MKISTFSYKFGLIFLAAAISLGAWWDVKEKKDSKEVTKSSEPQQISEPPHSELPRPKRVSNTPEPKKVAPETKKEDPIPVFQPASENDAVNTAFETAHVQKELTDIIERTSKLQNQVNGNRNELIEIMERAQIHREILKTIKTPRAIITPVQPNSDLDVVDREKIRLISEQTRQAQQQLEVIQRARAIKPQRASS